MIYSAILRIAKNKSAITADAIQRAVTDVIQLPLLVPDDHDYAKMIDQVIQNRKARRLPIDVDIG